MEGTMHQAKTQLSKLVDFALAGEEVILTRGRKRVPTARLVPMESAFPNGEIASFPKFKDGKRPIGLYRDQMGLGPDLNVFAPMSEEELAEWEAPIVSTWANQPTASGKAE